ncbi:TPA: NERD domain-containing protein [Proteus mirabilis]
MIEKKSIVKQVLTKYGACVSSDLASYIKMENPFLKPEAIRKMISREKGINRLAYVIFSHNRRFVYLNEDFGSNRFWRCLKNSLNQTNSTYGHAINALINNDGFLSEKDFSILSGCPLYQKKHLSYSTVLENLINSRLILKNDIEGVGVVYSLNNNKITHEIKEKIKLRVVFEEQLNSLVKSWFKNNGFVSYNKVMTKFDIGESTQVGSFNWCLSSPSYIHPLFSTSNNIITPGFVVCDYNFKSNENKILEVNETTANTFVKKIQLTINSRKNQRFMFAFFAIKFSKKAFEILKNNGVIPLTIANAFGKKIEESILSLNKLINDYSSISKNENKIELMLDELKNISGLNQNLRGLLFELYVACYAKDLFRYGVTYINKEFSIDGDKAEADVVIDSIEEITVIECKNTKKLNSNEVNKWLSKRISIINKYYKKYNPENKKIRHILLVSGVISEDGMSLLERLIINSKRKEITYIYGGDLKSLIKERIPKAYSCYLKIIK